MKLGVLTNLFGNQPLEEVIGKFEALGVESLELGCGGYPGAAHCDPEVLLDDVKARESLLSLIKSHGMDISALSVHGNPVHPD
jgi:sugar phosphate isomerase/epimerase